jgi:beta-lactamase regulating signal transducer with metallopeptidase domain
MNNVLTQAICWTLIHSLWQGLLLTIVAGTIMLFTKKASPAVRYRLLMVLFVAFLVVCGYTFILEWNSADATGTLIAGTLPVNHVLQNYGMGDLPAAWIQYCSHHALVIVTGWLIIFAFRCWQMTRALLYIRRIRGSRFQDPEPYWINKLHTLSQQLNIQRTVTLLESGITKIPVVVGHLKPVIYMPLGLLANLPADQVEAVLLHELAHIRRHDFIINLLQNIAETLFFFNPGLLWVSSLLKQEREHCCDDVALEHTCKKKQFIEALISFREHAVYGNRYVTAFPGKKNQLLQRVTRIIQNRNNSLNAPEKIFFLFSFLVGAVLLVAAGHKPLPVADKGMANQAPVVNRTLLNRPVVVEPKKAITIQKVKCSIVKKPVQICRKEIPQQKLEKTPEVYINADAAKPVIPQDQVNLLSADHAKNQAELDRLQAEKDRAHAELDRKQAENDRAQAELDRQQAIQHRLQADRDRAQADIDRRQAEKDRQQAVKDREQSERDRIAYAQKKAIY